MKSIKELQTDLASGRLSRRQFMQAMAAVGITAYAAPSLMSNAYAATPKKGGHLKIGLAGGNTTDSLDGATHTDAFMQILGMGMIYDCLTEVRADGSLGGELAESWEAEPGAQVWTFKLRKGVKFHNGKDFGADDVIESLQHHLGEKSKSAAKPIIAAVKEMKKVDDHTITFTLKNGNADFPFLLSDYHLLIYPAGQMAESIKKGIGTGGYTLESFEPGVRALAKRNSTLR